MAALARADHIGNAASADLVGRQRDRDRRAPALLGVDRDPAVVRGDDALGDREPDARAGLLGREARARTTGRGARAGCPGRCRRRPARPAAPRCPRWRHRAHADDDLAAGGRARLGRVRHDVEQRLAQQHAIAAHVGQPGRGLERDRHLLRARLRRDHDLVEQRRQRTSSTVGVGACIERRYCAHSS